MLPLAFLCPSLIPPQGTKYLICGFGRRNDVYLQLQPSQKACILLCSPGGQSHQGTALQGMPPVPNTAKGLRGGEICLILGLTPRKPPATCSSVQQVTSLTKTAASFTPV